MQDFRDTSLAPIRYLCHGGNPYEATPTYGGLPPDASAFFPSTHGNHDVDGALAALPWNLAVCLDDLRAAHVF